MASGWAPSLQQKLSGCVLIAYHTRCCYCTCDQPAGGGLAVAVLAAVIIMLLAPCGHGL